MALILIRGEARARHLAYLTQQLNSCPMGEPSSDDAAVEDIQCGHLGARFALASFAGQHVQIRRSAATAAPTSAVGKVSPGCQLPDQAAHLAHRAAARGS